MIIGGLTHQVCDRSCRFHTALFYSFLVWKGRGIKRLMKVNVTITALSLITTRAVEIPDWKVRGFYRFWFHSLSLTSHTFASTVDPNVQDLDTLALIKAHALVENRVAFRHFPGNEWNRLESFWSTRKENCVCKSNKLKKNFPMSFLPKRFMNNFPRPFPPSRTWKRK